MLSKVEEMYHVDTLQICDWPQRKREEKENTSIVLKSKRRNLHNE